MRKIILLVISLGTFWSLSGSPLTHENYETQVFKFFYERQWNEAIALSMKYIEQDPADCRAYKYLIYASTNEKNPLIGSLSYLDQMQRGNPRNHCVEYARGVYFIPPSQRQFERALDHFQRAIELNPNYYGSYQEIGRIYVNFRQYEEARNFYERALEAAKKVKDSVGEAEVRIDLAILYRYSSDPDRALKYLSEALTLSKRNIDSEARVLIRMAEAYLDLGDLIEAKRRCSESLAISKALNKDAIWYGYKTLAEIYLASGDVHMASGDIDRALTEYREAIDSGNRAIEVVPMPEYKYMLHISLGNAYLRIGEQDTALKHYEIFLNEAPEKANYLKFYRIEALGRTGEIYLKRGRYDIALDYLNRAVALAHDDKKKRLEMSWLKRIGDLHAEKHEYARARTYYDTVLHDVEEGFLQVGQTPGEEEYVFFDGVMDVYEAIVDLLLKMDKQYPERDYAKEAFDYIERSRAQSTLQALFQSRIVEKLLRETAKDEFRRKLAYFQDKAQSGYRIKLKKLGEKTRSKNPEEIKQLENEVRALEVDIKSSYRQMVNLIKRKLPDHGISNVVERVQQQVLTDKDALVKYMIMDEKTFVFILTKDEFRYEVIPIGRNAYKVTPTGKTEAVNSIRLLMRKASPLFPLPNEAPKRPRTAGEADVRLGVLNELYQTIFQPVEKHLRPGTQLIIVPDDALYYLPFEMLVTGLEPSGNPQYLLSRYPISYAYSAGLLLELPRTSDATAPTALLMANPDFGRAAVGRDGEAGQPDAAQLSDLERLARLDYTEVEIRKISRVIGNTIRLVGTNATEAAFKERAAQAGIIHIATHSIFDRHNYLDSKIIFALSEKIDQRGEDGVLYLHEIMNLNRLKAQMVVLTGCETSLGRLRRGGGLEGISRAFLSAGVPSVIGTLWPVADSEATSNLMAGFYKYLTQGMNKREALQKAKLDLLTENQYIDPFYWAPMILIGDMHEVKIEKNRGILVPTLAVSSLVVLFLLYLTRKRWLRKRDSPQRHEEHKG